jgi:hypothetical protein
MVAAFPGRMSGKALHGPNGPVPSGLPRALFNVAAVSFRNSGASPDYFPTRAESYERLRHPRKQASSHRRTSRYHAIIFTSSKPHFFTGADLSGSRFCGCWQDVRPDFCGEGWRAR